MNTSKIELTPVEQFDIKKLIFGSPETIPIKDSEGKTYTKCTVGYKNKEDELIPLFLQAPEEFSYGIGKNYPFGKAKSDENLKGYQMCIYLGDPKALNKPPNNEQKNFINVLKKMEIKLAEHLKANADNLDEKTAKLAEMNSLVSSIANHPKKEVSSQQNPLQKKKIVDKSKSLRFYVSLIMNKFSNKFVTTFYGPGDKLVDPLKYLDVQGRSVPIIKVEWIYIGSSSASFQIKLWECTYKPVELAPRKRLAPKNDLEDVPDVSAMGTSLLSSDDVSTKSDPNSDLDLPTGYTKDESANTSTNTSNEKSESPEPKKPVLKRIVPKKTVPPTTKIQVKKPPIKPKGTEQSLLFED